MKLSIPLAFFLAIIPAQLQAQGTGDLLTTVGTTVRGNDGQNRAYILWQPGEAASTLGKQFAVYAKPGPADSPTEFTRLGIQTLQTSPNTIRAVLELGAKIDLSSAALYERIDAIHREITLAPGAPVSGASDASLDSAGKLAFLIQSAVTDPKILSRLFFLGRAHPGVMQVLGHAFTVNIPAGIRTYEIREINNAGNDIRVTGRVTLDPASPDIPAAPSPPIQIFHEVAEGSQYPVNPKDHLNARFRWGIDEELRSQLPLTFGFDLYRVEKDTAENLGWHDKAPSPEEITNAVNSFQANDPNPTISRANDIPILVGDLLTPAQAADPNDGRRFDFADDGIWHTGKDGKSTRRPYKDGESFYFFVAARTITGAPGNLSTGTLVTMCDRLPPNPPSISTITSTFVRPADPADWKDQGGSQFLQLRIRQLPSSDFAEAARGYYVYRWDTSQEYLENIGNPTKGRVGPMIFPDPDRKLLTFNDNGANSPNIKTHLDKSVWYTVRAVGQSSCGAEILSGHSAPYAGVLRDFKAAAGPTGGYLVCLNTPTVSYAGRSIGKPEDIGLPAEYTGTTIAVTRLNPIITATEIEVFIKNKNQDNLSIYSGRVSFQTGDTVRVNLPIRERSTENSPLTIRIRSVAVNGRMSDTLERAVSNAQSAPYVTHSFTADATKVTLDIGAANPPIHESSDPDGTVNFISGFINFPLNQGIREWRIYRRIGSEGELTLIHKQEGGQLLNPGTWVDDAPPAATAATVCYYGQIFDQNANPSPMVNFGCTTMVNSSLPTPMLSAPEIIGEAAGTMTLQLEWFCDPAGVDRFEILTASAAGGIPQVTGLSDALTGVPDTFISSDFPDISFYPFQTPRVGAAMGNGPAFGIQVTVPANQAHYFAIRACGPGAYPRPSGSVSNVVSKQYTPQPTEAQPVIPWPARPLPGNYEHRVPIETFLKGEGPFWPVILPTDYRTPSAILIGLTTDPLTTNSIGAIATLRKPKDDTAVTLPTDSVFKVRESKENAGRASSLLPFVLYRYQLPSESFPDARPNLVQCTPLIDRISYRSFDDGKDKGFEIRDPFLLFIPFSPQSFLELPVSGNWSDAIAPTTANPATIDPRPDYLTDATGAIFLRDTLPVIQGCKYRYLITQFDSRGEIKRVIPVQPLQH
jgi:hypothetical protein